MPKPARFEIPMKRLSRLACFAIAILFVVAALGCRPAARIASASSITAGSGSCDQGLFAARAWDCLRGGHPEVR